MLLTAVWSHLVQLRRVPIPEGTKLSLIMLLYKIFKKKRKKKQLFFTVIVIATYFFLCQAFSQILLSFW